MRKRDEGPKHRELPILPALRVTIDAMKPTGLQTYLVTEFGKPVTANGSATSSETGATPPV
jgi:hypothetical protein